MTLEQIQDLLLRSKVTRSDLVALTGISRPTILRFFKGGILHVEREHSIKRMLQGIKIAAEEGTLPIVRGSTTDAAERLLALKEALRDGIAKHNEKRHAAKIAAESEPVASE